MDSTPTYLADIFGEVFLRIMYKGHMDKITGEGGGGGGRGFSWGGVEGWGVKAHNCNCITIKN